MNIENQLITLRVINFTEEHFRKLGYDVKNGDVITIPAKDLPNGSGFKVDVQCSYCGKIFKKAWRRYLETKDKCCCEECKEIKMMETSLEKYGNVCSLRNQKVQEKSKAKNMKNLGVQYPFQNKKILMKCHETLYKNGNNIAATSKQQLYINNLYNGTLNYPVDMYFADILLTNNLVVEYDGGGHALNVKYHTLSEREFNDRELYRESVFIDNGYKILRIICDNDKLPSDDILLKIKEMAEHLLNGNIYNVMTYNTQTQEIAFR